MLTKDKIFTLASRDARTGAIPKQNNLSPGQRVILDDPEFCNIKEGGDKLKSMQTKRNDLLKQMLSMQSVFEAATLKNTSRSSDLSAALEQAKNELDLLNVEIENEQNLLTNRGIVFPAQVTIEEDTEPKPKNGRKKGMRDRLNNFWQSIKKPLGRFTMFGVTEVFVAFLLWDILRDHKSQIQTVLRIASSAVIFGTLHFAEVKYKKNGNWWDIAYIIFAWLSAVILMFGSIFVLTAFPEVLDATSSLEQTFDLNATNTTGTIVEGSTWLASYVRYDFLIAVVCLLIFMLITILDKTEPKLKKSEQSDVRSTHEVEDVNPIFVCLLNLYTLKKMKAKEVSKLRADIEQKESEPSKLISKIDEELQSFRKEVELLNKDITSIKTEMQTSLTEVASKLNQYKVDYIDVFKNTVGSKFETPEWIEKPEIIKYYNI